MQRITFLAALLVVTVLFSSSLLGQSPTGAGYNLNDYQVRTAQDLLNICTVDSYHTDYNEARSFCYGYLEGGRAYHDGLVVLEDYVPIVCPPPNATRQDAAGVFVAFATANPQHMEKPTMQMVVRALAEKWPCKK